MSPSSSTVFTPPLESPFDRESLVSSLTKKVARQDRFLRTDKNTFALRLDSK
jgi:hypothetical protein